MKVFANIKHRSERVPGKNLRELAGVPLWRHTLEKYADHEVYVDTDSAEILDGCAVLPFVTAYRRYHHHHMDPEPGLRMLFRFLAERVTDPDEPVAVVNVTAPFVRSERVVEAAETVATGSYDSALSVTEIRDFAFRRAGCGLVPLNHDMRSWPRTQDLDPVLVLNHAFYVVTKATLERLQHRVGTSPLLVPLPFPENVDIDWPEDWALAEAVAAQEAVHA